MKFFRSLTLCAAAIICCLSLAQCSSAKKGSKETTSASSAHSGRHSKLSPQVIDSLLGDWNVTQVDSRLINMERLPTVSLTLNDNENLAQAVKSDNIVLVYAFSGCNTVNGAFEVKAGHKIEPKGDFISTMMLCPDAIDYDRAVTAAVTAARSYRLAENDGESTLSFFNDKGERVLRLTKHNLEFLNGAWRVSRLGGTELPVTADVAMVIDLPEGRLHANGGCNIINGNVEQVADVNAGLRFTNLASTLRSCPDMQREMEFVRALDAVAKACKGGRRNTALLLDSAGNTLMTLSRMDIHELKLLGEAEEQQK